LGLKHTIPIVNNTHAPRIQRDFTAKRATVLRTGNSFIEIAPPFTHLFPMKRFFLIGMSLALAVVGCDKTPPASAPIAASAGPALPTQAQPKLRTIRLWLGPEELTTELALTQEQVMTGLMFRTNMDEMSGMIFVFSRPTRVAFWMKNCPLPLSCAYITPEGEIAEIHDMQPYNTNSIDADSANIQFVLEVNQGWFTRHHIQTGTSVRTERGTLQQTFFPSQ
jgi:hypothetical protein